MQQNRAIRCICVALATLVAQPVAAQVPPLPPPGSPLPAIVPSPPPSLAPPVAPVPSEPLLNTAPDVQVAVATVTFTGVTAFPQAEIVPLAAGLTGAAVPLRRIEDARLGLVKKYRDAGYPLVVVSASLLTGGHLQFLVSEGYIADVKLDGDIGPAATQVLRFLNHLTETRPIDVATLERWLLLAQDVPGVGVQAVLRASDAEPGALTLIARVRRVAVNGLLTADNRAYQFTGPQEWLGVFDLNSFTSLGERTEISLYGDFNQTQIFGQASSEVFVGSSGLRIRVYAGDGDTTPSGALRTTLGYEAKTFVAGVQASYPVIRARQQTLNLFAMFDAIQSKSDSTTTGLMTDDQLRVLRLAAEYDRRDLLAGDERPAVNVVNIRLSQGLSAFGASENGSPEAARIGERIDFRKVNAEISRNQTLFSPWNGATVGLLALATGQVSPDVLPPVEKFYLGGLGFTRGFYSGEVTGDSALAVTEELQLNTSYNFEMFGKSIDAGLQFYGFYDWGYAWQNLSTDANKRLQSTGLGLRMTLTQYTEFDIEGVARLTRQPEPNSANVPPLSSRALYWRVLTRF